MGERGDIDIKGIQLFAEDKGRVQLILFLVDNKVINLVADTTFQNPLSFRITKSYLLN